MRTSLGKSDEGMKLSASGSNSAQISLKPSMSADETRKGFCEPSDEKFSRGHGDYATCGHRGLETVKHVVASDHASQVGQLARLVVLCDRTERHRTQLTRRLEGRAGRASALRFGEMQMATTQTERCNYSSQYLPAARLLACRIQVANVTRSFQKGCCFMNESTDEILTVPYY